MTLKTVSTPLLPPMLLMASLMTLSFACAAEPELLNSNKYKIKVESIADRLRHPSAMVFLPTPAEQDWQLLVSERQDGLKLISQSGNITPMTMALPVSQRGDGGLLGLAVSPDFKEDRQIFVSYSHQHEDGTASTAVARGLLNNNQLSAMETIFISQPSYRGSRQFGGRLAIEGNCLWLSVGDRGDEASAQQPKNHSGSLLRIDVNGAPCAGNPNWAEQSIDARPEIISYGHREVLGLTIDDSGQVWSHEAGRDRGDELNLITPGGNYGWPAVTQGTRIASRVTQGAQENIDGMLAPVFTWVSSIKPSGLLRYNGELFPEWQGNLFLGSIKFGKLIRLDLRDGEVFKQERLLKNRYGPIRDIAQGQDGAIYLLTDSSNGHLLRITPAQ